MWCSQFRTWGRKERELWKELGLDELELFLLTKLVEVLLSFCNNTFQRFKNKAKLKSFTLTKGKIWPFFDIRCVILNSNKLVDFSQGLTFVFQKPFPWQNRQNNLEEHQKESSRWSWKSSFHLLWVSNQSWKYSAQSWTQQAPSCQLERNFFFLYHTAGARNLSEQ